MAQTFDEDPNLLDYCASDTQRRIVREVLKGGTRRQAADRLGMHERTVLKHLSRVKQLASAQGYAPQFDMTKPAPAGFAVKGVSTLYNAEGDIAAQWVKTQLDQAQRVQMLKEACIEALSDIPKRPRIKPPQRYDEDLMAEIPLGDPHVGMYAWQLECGDNYDTKIAMELHEDAVDRLVAQSPKAKVGVLLNLGDFFHSDNMEGRTRKSGNALDTDTRWGDVLVNGIVLMERLISRMLERYQTVIVRNNIGNHDEHSSMFLAVALQRSFKDNPRVEVDMSPHPMWYYRHGKVMIGSTHGDSVKPQQLVNVMATKRAEDWAASEDRYIHIGHVHHKSVHEFPGCLVESFRTLAAKDAWHTKSALESARDMVCIIHSTSQGEEIRYRVKPKVTE